MAKRPTPAAVRLSFVLPENWKPPNPKRVPVSAIDATDLAYKYLLGVLIVEIDGAALRAGSFNLLGIASALDGLRRTRFRNLPARFDTDQEADVLRIEKKGHLLHITVDDGQHLAVQPDDLNAAIVPFVREARERADRLMPGILENPVVQGWFKSG